MNFTIMDENPGAAAAQGVQNDGGGIKVSVPRLDLSVDRYSAFKSWKSKWDDYVMLSNLEAKQPAYQAAMF